jgi:hypothetical protein
MFQHLSYQKKLKWLGISILPVLFICYQLAIKKTIQEYQTFRRSLGQSATLSTSTALADLTDRKTRVLSLYDRFSLDTFATDKNLLSIAGAFCKSHELMLKEYRTVGLGKLDSTRVLTRVMTFEGHFIPGVKFIYELEAKRMAGHVSSVQFATIEDRQNKSTKLDLTLYIQNLIP